MAKLAEAFATQSRLAARAGLYGQMAERQGNPALARYFKAAQSSREVHARRLLMLLRGKIPTSVTAAAEEFARETLQAQDLLAQGMEATAGIPGKGWGASFEQFLAVEKRLAELSPKGEEADDLFICQICGYPASAEPPARCPVCGAIPEKFQKIE